MKKLLSIALFLPWIARATTYYIDPLGNDAVNVGSLANPWKTLYKATTTVATVGDIIHVNVGSYLEVKKSLLAPGVSIEGAGATSIIKSTATADYESIIEATSTEGTDGNQHISNLKFDGQSRATSWGVFFSGRKNVSVDHCTFVDLNQLAVCFSGRNDAVNGPPSIYATGNSFHDNVTNNCSGWFGYGTGALYIGGQKDMLVYNNTMAQAGRTGGYNGWLIKCQKNNGYTKNLQVYNNHFTKDPELTAGQWDFGFESFNNEGLVIHDNDWHGCGADMNYQIKGAYPHGAWIYNNSFDYPAIPVKQYQSAITTEYDCEDVLIENNICNGATTFVNQTPRDGNHFTNVTIRNNLSYNMGMAGTAGFAIRWDVSGMRPDAVIKVKNYHIENNTFKAYPGMALYGVRFPDGNPDSPRAIVSSDSIYLINNIFQGFVATAVVANPAAGINHLWMQKNIFFNNGNSDDPIWSGGVPSNIVTIGGNYKADPLLGANYLPGPGSPAIGNALGGSNIGYRVTGPPPVPVPTYPITTKVISWAH